ncbi:hypothetical protein ACFB49_47180 [Sphingomonas sp. DBB INV C78]|uniref:PEPxxWA-CTERM sorting domain-containing protein n=1 Tax=Sphingomonas sp. DBB INV C78 TaxID=3349434 RepID=UPI0036D24BF4
MFKKLALALALSGAATSAQAATFIFTDGQYGVQSGQTLVADFNGADDALVSGNNFKFLTGSSGEGAQPDPGDATRYLSILGGGHADISLGQAASFGLDVGSLDSYNTLTLLFADGTSQDISGDDIFGGDANGDQHSPNSNGRILVTADAGQTIVGLRLSSSSNSFEVDNLAVTPVPEPATWAMMLAGFGLVGAGLRSRRREATAQIA